VTTGPDRDGRSPQQTEIAQRWRSVLERVSRAATQAGRDPRDVTILLPAKTQSPEAVRAAVDAGARLLGHNRVQELVAMAPDLADLSPVWHVIGPLQSNKVNAALRWASCVQTVADLSLAERLSRRCDVVGRELNVMVQVNVSGEFSKAGVEPSGAVGLATAVAALPHLRLTGLMTIGANSPDTAVVRRGFARLRELRDELVSSGAPGTESAHELSMGMSRDLEAAIAEGATIVRPGTAVFGPRR
jgi:PLP dependent protein